MDVISKESQSNANNAIFCFSLWADFNDSELMLRSGTEIVAENSESEICKKN